MSGTVLHVGAAETVSVTARDQIVAMRDFGWDAVVACADESYVERLEEAGVRWVPLGLPSHPGRADLAQGAAQLARLIRGPIALVHTHNAHHGVIGRLLARACGRPSVHTWRYNPVDAATYAGERAAFALVEALASRAGSSVLFQNRDDFRYAVRGHIVPVAKARYVGNGIPLAQDQARRPTRREGRTRLGIPPDAPVVICVARLAERKRQTDLLQALADLEHRDAMLVLVGSGPDRAMLEQQVRESGLSERVLFTGDRKDVPELLAAADVFCLASRREGVPRAVMEAMASGVPVVATDVVGTRDLVIDGVTGLLVPCASPRELGRALDRLLRNPDTGRELAGAALKNLREHWDQKRYVERIDAAYRDAVLGSPTAS
jgi:glycosyltransferase involved in cell wall biosynthesis